MFQAAGLHKLIRFEQEEPAAAGEEVVVITIAQKLSGTYQCAHLAAADVGLQVHIVDSEAASQGEALLVREAVRLRDEEGMMDKYNKYNTLLKEAKGEESDVAKAEETKEEETKTDTLPKTR